MSTVSEVVEELLSDDHCMVHINPAYPGVVLPESLRKTPTVTLKLSHYFAGMVAITEKEITAELRFQGMPFTCVIPCAAVWGVTSTSGIHTTWDENAPHPKLPEKLKQNSSGQVSRKTVKTKDATRKEQSPAKDKPSFLKRVK